MKKFGWAFMMCAAIAMGSLMSACSSDDNDDNGGGGGGQEQKDPEVTYKGTTAYSEGLVFNNGTELGNGSQNFHLTGTVALTKGTYLLKGWVYVDKGAKLYIPAGTVIKGDKQTMAALIIEPGGYAEMKGTKSEPIVMTSEEAPGNRKPGDWGGLSSAVMPKTTKEPSKSKADRLPYTVVTTMPTTQVSISTSA